MFCRLCRLGQPACSSSKQPEQNLKVVTVQGEHTVPGNSQQAHSKRTLRQAWRVPRTVDLCKLLVVLVLLLVALHAASCGFFFCVRRPGSLLELPSSIHDDISDIYRLRGGPRFNSPARDPLVPDDAPKLIPKIVHQAYRTSSVPKPLRPLMQSWRQQNEGWEIRFYDAEACVEFVQREFPEYLEAYRALSREAERADFFRYMVVLRLGGVYADVDTECRRPLSQIIRPMDTLVVGWDNEFATPEAAAAQQYARQRQALQWVFAGAPGHPALREICEHIAQNVYTRFSADTIRNTQERTGAGVWTDIVLRNAFRHPLFQRDDPWNVRILPRVHFGTHPAGQDGLSPNNPRVVVLHHLLESWQQRAGWKPHESSLLAFLWRVWTAVARSRLRSSAAERAQRQAASQAAQLFPVSVEWSPPFTMMTHLAGHGDVQSGSDPAAAITAWGSWQPGLAPHRGPTVADALIGSLGGRNSSHRVLLDIGAGLGYFSLAAAARGNRAIALELAPASLQALQASVRYNAFDHLVTVKQVAAGSAAEEICVRRAGRDEVHLSRGYSSRPDAHNASLLDAEQGACLKTARREAVSSLVPAGTSVGAVRISVNGWDAHVVEGLQGLVQQQQPPAVVVLDFQPSAHGDAAASLAMLRQLHAWGYTDISHSGAVCDERWHSITKGIRLRGAISLAAKEALRQPTWCRLQPDHFAGLVDRAAAKSPENVLLVYKPPPPRFTATAEQLASAPPLVLLPRSNAAGPSH